MAKMAFSIKLFQLVRLCLWEGPGDENERVSFPRGPILQRGAPDSYALC